MSYLCRRNLLSSPPALNWMTDVACPPAKPSVTAVLLCSFSSKDRHAVKPGSIAHGPNYALIAQTLTLYWVVCGHSYRLLTCKRAAVQCRWAAVRWRLTVGAIWPAKTRKNCCFMRAIFAYSISITEHKNNFEQLWTRDYTEHCWTLTSLITWYIW